MLELKGLCKSYQRLPVLDQVSLSVGRGESVCLAGANAQGKTTLLSIAAGVRKPDAGSVSADGRIGFVPQENTLVDELSVYDHLLLWYSASGRKKSELFEKNAAEERLGLLAFSKKKARNLSGGIQKRLAIAGALCKRPAYLLMDEPFTALGAESKKMIVELMRELLKGGTGILFSSHDPVRIAEAAGRLAVIQGGAIIRDMILPEDQKNRLTLVRDVLEA